MCGKHATALNSGRQIFAFGDLERRGVFILTSALSYSLCYAKASEGGIAAGARERMEGDLRYGWQTHIDKSNGIRGYTTLTRRSQIHYNLSIASIRSACGPVV